MKDEDEAHASFLNPIIKPLYLEISPSVLNSATLKGGIFVLLRFTANSSEGFSNDILTIQINVPSQESQK